MRSARLTWMKVWSSTLLLFSSLSPTFKIWSQELSLCLEESAPTSLWIHLKMLHFWPRLALITKIPSNLCNYLVLALFMFPFLSPWNTRMWNWWIFWKPMTKWSPMLLGACITEKKVSRTSSMELALPNFPLSTRIYPEESSQMGWRSTSSIQGNP